ncbi:sulfur carrier protein ThiS adenylyltransferase [Hypnocyclicus thermotrophus]|uniref:Sulfur carrier protein ThiS adenylyltransferase n=1 Tax=Hypnocyclicus thermotrophus TaxID=1627895 RepID=A0AA46DZR1_9FUSO|nr:sulfur carrier protein ThiS adenylyltransferase ThiF [Hypnocyclicus thermotrophus]TDT71977.1 sulfur carrier protein ThiS adenylyltransferase [Hypnocyclicus thermotrophus]
MKIGIAGAGGLGSNVAMNLVRTGVLNLKIIDFDRIEESNLNRQFYFYDQIGITKVEALKENLIRINNNLRIEIINEKIEKTNIKKLFEDCDIVIEAFDKDIYKKLFFNTFYNKKKLLVSASGVAGNTIDNLEIKKIGNSFIVGDFQKGIDKHKTYSTKVSMVAAMMANIVLLEGGFCNED